MRFTSLIFLVFLLTITSFCGIKKQPSLEFDNNRIQGIGEISSKDVEVDMFRYLEIDLNADVELIQSDSLNVHIEGQQNILNLLDIYVSNSHLYLKLKKSNIQYDSLKILIYTPSIQSIIVNGSGKFHIQSWQKEDKLHFVNNGSTIFYVSKLSHIRNVHIQINGSGSFFSSQESQLIPHIQCELNGIGNINLEKIPVDHAKVEINGSGNIEFGEVEQINAKLVGIGNITYFGKPKIIQEIIGSGTINQK